jgi:hypothetical protein
MAKRASEDQFDQLHSLVTVELIGRIQTGEASTADIRAAIEWLSKNNITGAPVEGSPLSKLTALIPELTIDDVQGAL